MLPYPLTRASVFGEPDPGLPASSLRRLATLVSKHSGMLVTFTPGPELETHHEQRAAALTASGLTRDQFVAAYVTAVYEFVESPNAEVLADEVRS